jgi:formate/nitrite transporter
MINEGFSQKNTAFEVVELGVKKGHTPFIKTFVLGSMGGMFISLGYLGAIVAVAGAEGMLPLGAIKMLAGLLFPVGIIFVVLVGGDIFTGNSLISLSTIVKKTSLKQLAFNWIAVLLGNIIGAVTTAFLMYYADLFNKDMISYVIHTAEYKSNLSNTQIIISGFFCNIVVALAVWASLSTKDVTGKILSLYIPIFLFVVSGYQHCIANMFIFTVADLLGAGIPLVTSINVVFMSVIGNAISGGIVIPFVYYYLFIKGTDIKN